MLKISDPVLGNVNMYLTEISGSTGGTVRFVRVVTRVERGGWVERRVSHRGDRRIEHDSRRYRGGPTLSTDQSGRPVASARRGHSTHAKQWKSRLLVSERPRRRLTPHSSYEQMFSLLRPGGLILYRRDHISMLDWKGSEKLQNISLDILETFPNLLYPFSCKFHIFFRSIFSIYSGHTW